MKKRKAKKGLGNPMAIAAGAEALKNNPDVGKSLGIATIVLVGGVVLVGGYITYKIFSTLTSIKDTAVNAATGAAEYLGLKYDQDENAALAKYKEIQARPAKTNAWSPTYFQLNKLSASYPTATFTALAKTIWNAMGGLLSKDNFTEAIGALSQLKKRADLSFLAYIFYQNYNRDLLDFLFEHGKNELTNFGKCLNISEGLTQPGLKGLPSTQPMLNQF